MSAPPAIAADLGGGVYLIDSGFVRPELAGSYLLRGRDATAFVEVGTALSTPRLLAALDALNIDRAEIGYVVVTHVHLDHAGGAGTLLGQLPKAKLVVHPRGARHMADPTKLIAGATQVYGESVLRQHYGTILPVPTERIVEAVDGFVLDLGARPLRFLSTPGHAKHHLVVFDEKTRGAFTGDAFGLAYPNPSMGDRRFIFPTTSPVQFDPEAMKASIDRIMALDPGRIYLTHYGMLDDDLPRYAGILKRLVDAHVDVARTVGLGADAEAQIKAGLVTLFQKELGLQDVTEDHQAALASWDMDLQLNAQGLLVWLKRSISG